MKARGAMSDDTSPLSAGEWVTGFFLLILCQVLGEAVVQLARGSLPGLVFPGPVAGLLLLLLLLPWLKRSRRAVTGAAQSLLGFLTLLFVPAAIGIIEHGPLIRAWGLPLLLAVVVSTILTLLVTVGAFIGTETFLGRKQK